MLVNPYTHTDNRVSVSELSAISVDHKIDIYGHHIFVFIFSFLTNNLRSETFLSLQNTHLLLERMKNKREYYLLSGSERGIVGPGDDVIIDMRIESLRSWRVQKQRTPGDRHRCTVRKDVYAGALVQLDLHSQSATLNILLSGKGKKRKYDLTVSNK